MVETHGGVEIEEISSIPEGHAIIDTGCTTSVVGEETAAAYTEFFKRSGFPAPQPVELLLIHMMMMMLKLKPHQTKVMSMHVFVVVNMNMKKPINTMPLILKPCMEEDNNWVDAVSNDTIPQESQDHLLNSIRALRRVGSRLVVSRVQEDPKGVKRDLQAWLGDQAFKLDAPVGLIEAFTGKANLSKQYEKKTGLHAIRLGLEYGQDFARLQDRRNLLLLIAFCRPHHVWVSFPCKHWGPWSRFNMARSLEQKQEILSQRAKARRYLHNICEDCVERTH